MTIRKSWGKGHRRNWIGSLLAKGCRPTITLAGEYDGDGSAEERAWIKYFRDDGAVLVNGTEGGEGPNVMAQIKMSAALLGKGHTDEHKERIRQSAFKRWSNDGARKKQGIAAKKAQEKSPYFLILQFNKQQRKKERIEKALQYKTWLQSPEGRKEMQRRASLLWRNPDKRSKLRATMKLVSSSVEWRRKNSDRQKAFYATEEGRKIKSEAVRKMRETLHIRKANNQTMLAI